MEHEVGGLYIPKRKQGGESGSTPTTASDQTKRHSFRSPEPRVSKLGTNLCLSCFHVAHFMLLVLHACRVG